MPAKSEKQRKFMAAVANNPKFAKKAGVPQSVGEEFMEKKMAKGGKTFKTCASCPTPAACKKAGKCAKAGKGYKAGGKLEMVEKDGKKVPFYAADGKGKMKSGGKVKKYQAGGAVGGMSGMPGMGMSEEEKRKRMMNMARGQAGARSAAGMTSGMKAGGKVRGCGKATKGVRPAKMR